MSTPQNTANSPIPASASSDTSGSSKVGHATTTAPAPSAATSHSSASYLTLSGSLNDYQSGFGHGGLIGLVIGIVPLFISTVAFL